jgi:hypothetical protein
MNCFEISSEVVVIIANNKSVALVRERTIPAERQPFVGEVSANFIGQRGAAWSALRIPTTVISVF